MAPCAWPVLVKVAFVWVPAVVIMLVTYDLLVRDTWVGRWLNGRRYPRLIMSRTRERAPRDGR